MNFLRKHWYDIGGILGICTCMFVMRAGDASDYQKLLWLNLMALFFHQFEEYRFPGTFPGMINRVMYHSDRPDRYPLNTNTSLIINVIVGWISYFLAAWSGKKAIWLGIATILISAGNVVAHTILFNLKGKTLYNAGMATSWILLAPCVYYFFSIIISQHLATTTDYLVGVPLGIVLNVIGILKLIDWLSDRKTRFIFDQRNLLRRDRQQGF